MISIDTNYLLRFLTHDVESQFNEVEKIISDDRVDIYISSIVLAETIHVLENHHYKVAKSDAIDAIINLLLNKNIKTEIFMNYALEIYSSELISFYDSLIAAEAIHKNLDLKTFDKKLEKVYKKYTDK